MLTRTEAIPDPTLWNRVGLMAQWAMHVAKSREVWVRMGFNEEGHMNGEPIRYYESHNGGILLPARFKCPQCQDFSDRTGRDIGVARITQTTLRPEL